MQPSILIWTFVGLQLICFKKVNDIYLEMDICYLFLPLLVLIILPYVKSLDVFVITSLHKVPPIFYFTHSSGDPVECGPCNYYLLLIGYHISGTKL